ncbi:MAG: GNAT family N-acetyltransferase [Candidatus Limnocylindrales bacterium]
MLEIRQATSDEDLAHLSRIVCSVTPDFPTSVEEVRWGEQAYPGGRRFLAWLDGQPVGCGGAGRMYIYPPEYEGLWGSVTVLPEHRRRGVGAELLATVSTFTHEAGKRLLLGRVTADRLDAIDFLEHRGFAEYERMKAVRLDLEGLVPGPVAPPPGVVISSLEQRPDLVDGVYRVAVEAMPDIPGDGPIAPATLDEFRVLEVDRPAIPAGGFAVAIDAATDLVVGYASLLVLPGNPTVAWNGMTAVGHAWRGRGVASALKRATIAWASTNGILALETANDVSNAPMRAVNARLGYEPRPDEIYYRGPVAPFVTVPA